MPSTLFRRKTAEPATARKHQGSRGRPRVLTQCLRAIAAISPQTQYRESLSVCSSLTSESSLAVLACKRDAVGRIDAPRSRLHTSRQLTGRDWCLDLGMVAADEAVVDAPGASHHDDDDEQQPLAVPWAHAALIALAAAPLFVPVNTNVNVIATATLTVFIGCRRSVKPEPPEDSMSQKVGCRPAMLQEHACNQTYERVHFPLRTSVHK